MMRITLFGYALIFVFLKIREYFGQYNDKWYIYLYMNIKPEIVKTLLDSLMPPQFDDIVDYDIITRQNDEGKTGIGIDVIMKHKLDDSLYIKQREVEVERKIRNIMKYISPAFVMVEFYATNNY